MAYTMRYTNWEGVEKVWDVHTQGIFMVQATERLENPDGTVIVDSCLARFNSAFEANQVTNLLRIARPDWAKKIRSIKTPCVFDAGRAFVVVERWL